MSEPDDRQAQPEGRDLIAVAQSGELDPVYFRGTEVEALVTALGRRRSALVFGPAGVGKSAVIRGAAHEMQRLGKGGMVEVSALTALTGTHLTGDWRSRLLGLARGAMTSSSVLAVSDMATLLAPATGEDAPVLDVLLPLIESHELVVVGELTPESQAALERTPRLAALFDTVAILPLDARSVDGVLERAAARAGLDIDAAGRQTLVEVTTRFLPARPQPGPALALLQQVDHYLHEKAHVGERASIDRAFVERVFSIYSGLPRFIVSRDVTMAADDMRTWFHERVVGQDEAIESVVEAIALFKTGLHDTSRPIATLLFAGPAGVGKTELARSLATFLFGSSQRMVRVDLAQLGAEGSVHVLTGSAEHPERRAPLLDAVRAQPFQVVILDDLEKAHPTVGDALIPLLREGCLVPPTGEPVDFRSTVVICTTHAGANEPTLRAVSPGEDLTDEADRVRNSLRRRLRGDLVGQFQRIAVFHPLSHDQVRRVARRELAIILGRDGIVSRHITVDVDEAALDLAIARGFSQRFGARGLRDEIQSLLVVPAAMALMQKSAEPGQVVRVTAIDGRVEVRVNDRAESVPPPLRIPSIGGRRTREDVDTSVGELATRLEGVSLRVGEAFLREELDRLSERVPARRDESASAQQELDFARAALDLLEHLRVDIEQLSEQCARTTQRESVATLGQRAAELEAKLELTELQLVCMGRSERHAALVEIRPVGETAHAARDMLVRTYTDWAAERGFAVDTLREPLDPDEEALLSIAGEYAYGFLRHEAGLHRIVEGKSSSVVRVRVAPRTGRRVPVGFREEYALKRVGTFGGKVRSRVECDGGLVLQNSRSLAENRDLAMELAGSWRAAPPSPDDIVRRYEPQAPLVRDVLTDSVSDHRDALRPERFHALLCRRVRRMWELREPPPPAA